VKLEAYYLFVFNAGKKAKSLSLAPVEVEILVSRCSALKIVTDGGTMLAEKA
jgi:hypothetical protein